MPPSPPPLPSNSFAPPLCPPCPQEPAPNKALSGWAVSSDTPATLPDQQGQQRGFGCSGQDVLQAMEEELEAKEGELALYINTVCVCVGG